MEGGRLGRYRIVSKLAEGGMGAVYLATHELMDRDVAIKVLLPQVSAERDIVQRFFNEARATGSLNHPGIVAIFDLDQAEDGRAYIVMERLQGETLQQRLRRVRRLSVGQSVDVARQLASALAAAHGKGVVHRDLKPSNIFLCEDPEIPGRERSKILDFGVAKLAQQQGSLATRAGACVGTPTYMSPEQCRDSSAVDHRADLYALGCVMYDCLCGGPPFVGDAVDVLAAHLRDTPMSPRTFDPALPPWVDEMIMRLLEKDPARRFQSCAQVIEALDHGASQAWQRGPASWGAEAAVALVPPQAEAPDRPSGRDISTQSTGTHGNGSTAFSMVNTAADAHGSSIGAPRKWLGIGASALVLLGFGLYLVLASSGRGSDVLVLHAPEIQSEPRPGTTGAVEASDERHVSENSEMPEHDDESADHGAGQPTQPVSADSNGDMVVKKIAPKAEARPPRLSARSDERENRKEPDDAPESQPEGRERDLTLVKKWSKQGECDDIEALQPGRPGVESELAALIEQCEQTRKKPAVAAVKGAAPPSPGPERKPETSGGPELKPAGELGQFHELLTQAQEAAKQGFHAKAHQLCQQALELRPGEPRAVDVCAVAACNLGNAVQARGYYAMASKDSQTLIHRYCLAKGIDLAK